MVFISEAGEDANDNPEHMAHVEARTEVLGELADVSKVPPKRWYKGVLGFFVLLFLLIVTIAIFIGPFRYFRYESGTYDNSNNFWGEKGEEDFKLKLKLCETTGDCEPYYQEAREKLGIPNPQQN